MKYFISCIFIPTVQIQAQNILNNLVAQNELGFSNDFLDLYNTNSPTPSSDESSQNFQSDSKALSGSVPSISTISIEHSNDFLDNLELALVPSPSTQTQLDVIDSISISSSRDPSASPTLKSTGLQTSIPSSALVSDSNSSPPSTNTMPPLNYYPSNIPTKRDPENDLTGSLSEEPSSAPSTKSSLLPSKERTIFLSQAPTSNENPEGSRKTHKPSIAPSIESSSTPSMSPFSLSSNSPSHNPSPYSTSIPSVELSNFPSSTPTAMKDSTYFNYNPTSKYGPKNWPTIQKGDASFFGDFLEVDGNECDESRQSPIDLTWEQQCLDDHQIHTERGSNDWNTIKFEVLPHALRARFKTDYKPARADFSNLSNFIEAYYMDIKLPSEHKMEGKQYYAEVQIGHDFNSRGVNIGFFLDPVSNVHNARLDEFIRAWEEISWKKKYECETYGETASVGYKNKYPVRTKDEMERIWTPHPDRAGSADWDLYQLLPTVWYYGYKGSLTVPPCTQTIFWRFLDLPAKISWKQYERMKKLIVEDNIDEKTCLPHKVSFEGGINRPVQINKSDTFRCKGWKIRYKEDWENVWPSWYHGNNKM